MEKEKKEELKERYKKTFDYEPTMEEAAAKYDDDFNKWLDDLKV